MKVSLMALAFGFLLAVGFPLAAMAGPVPGGSDGDGDTVEDAFDNCSALPNASQTDSDHDGCGNACDFPPVTADADGDNAVGIGDFAAVSGEFGLTDCGGTDVCTADFDGDTSVGLGDFGLLTTEFGNFIGPSGISNPSRDLVECPL